MAAEFLSLITRLVPFLLASTSDAAAQPALDGEGFKRLERLAAADKYSLTYDADPAKKMRADRLKWYRAGTVEMFAKGDGALYHRPPDGVWRHLHGACPPPAAAPVPPESPFSGRIPLMSRAKRGLIAKAMAPSLRRVAKTLWRWGARLRGKRGAA